MVQNGYVFACTSGAKGFLKSVVYESFTTLSLVFRTLKERHFEISDSKGKYDANHHLLLFSHCFLPYEIPYQLPSSLVNFVPKDKVITLSKFKVFPDKLKMSETAEFVLDRVDCGKRRKYWFKMVKG